MKNALRALDRILRGDATRLPQLQQGRFDIPIRSLLALIVLLGMIYGACMGLSAVITRWGTAAQSDGFKQLGASLVKVPMLFVLTLLVTFPSLYVFNALVGSRLTMVSLLRLLVAALSVMLAVLASFGPIVGFFAASTTSYPFMKILNVIVFTIAGFLGLAFLLQTLHRLTIAQEFLPPPQEPPATLPPLTTLPPPDQLPGAFPSAGSPPPPPPPPAGALDGLPDHPPAANVRLVFRIWVIVFGLVGAQMGWILRPFIGNPDQPFSFFRPRQSNFFEGVLHALEHLFSLR